MAGTTRPAGLSARFSASAVRSLPDDSQGAGLKRAPNLIETEETHERNKTYPLAFVHSMRVTELFVVTSYVRHC